MEQHMSDAHALPVQAPPDRDLLLSGGGGRNVNSCRAGYLPVGLDRVPLPAMERISVYIRVRANAPPGVIQADSQGQFSLYCADSIRFCESHRRRLIEHGVKFIYIRMADQSRFRRQTEAYLENFAADPAVAVAEKSAIIYETSVELINELLTEPESVMHTPRLEQVSRAITTLVINNPKSFSHLFAASHHDFYTATHMVNVATWMVPLAYELGHTDPEELSRICQAGMLHDMGKVTVPEAILNKTGTLTDDDWVQIKRHPEAGVEYLSRFEGIHPLVLRVTHEHHERMDGSGYPRGLIGPQIDPISRICAVVDSFDAMTAFRPFKQRTLSVDEALDILQKETPSKYDPAVMEAWMHLIRSADVVSGASDVAPDAKAGGLATLVAPTPGANRRKHERQKFSCPGRAHLLMRGPHGIEERPGIAVIAHSLSRGGIGFLTQTPIEPGEYLRIYLQAKGWERRSFEGQTVRCRSYDDQWNEIGFEFTAVDIEALSWKSTAA
jgi:HD-GYP domain-containing protein (c-di-GMP phosphodiesterase class II)